jgi:hypothetical protein
MPRAASKPYVRGPKRGGAIAIGIAALIVSVLAACSSGGKNCSLVGAYSGVSVKVDPGLLPSATPATVTACVEGVCQTTTYTPATSPMFVAVSPVKNGDVTVSVSLAVGTRQVFTGKTTARTIKNEPNGPGCNPKVWEADVTVHASGQLTG